MIPGNEGFADCDIGPRRSLGDDNATVLTLNDQVPQAADPTNQLAQDRRPRGVVVPEVHHGIFIIDGRKCCYHAQLLGNPVMPDIGEAKLQGGVARGLRYVGRPGVRLWISGLKLFWLFRSIPQADAQHGRAPPQ